MSDAPTGSLNRWPPSEQQQWRPVPPRPVAETHERSTGGTDGSLVLVWLVIAVSCLVVLLCSSALWDRPERVRQVEQTVSTAVGVRA